LGHSGSLLCIARPKEACTRRILFRRAPWFSRLWAIAATETRTDP
jgi:hypothetical protein